MSKICLACCQPFSPNIKTISKQIFCSSKCNGFYNRRLRKGISPYFTVLRKIVCIKCGQQFNQRDTIYHKYCSDECQKISQQPKTKTTIRKFTCGVCEVVFDVKNNLTAKYCSDKCRSLARYRKMVGFPVKAPRVRSRYGDGYINKAGYRIVYKDHPNANPKTKCILEHIYIMSTFLGRPMKKGETVHHKNGIRSDNRLENLELWTSRHPSGVNYEHKIKSAIAFLEEEGYKITKE